MGKNKPRWYPNKKQNKIGGICASCDVIDEKMFCEYGDDTKICKGNPHNCIKTFYHKNASLSDNQKIEINRKGNK